MQRVQDRERRAREALSRFGIEVPGEVWHPAAATRAADSRAIAPTEPIHGIDPHNHLQEHDIQVPAGTAAGATMGFTTADGRQVQVTTSQGAPQAFPQAGTMKVKMLLLPRS